MRSEWPLFFGASWLPGQGVRFRVWAPNASLVEVELHRQEGLDYHQLATEGDGIFSGVVVHTGPDTRYKYRLNGQDSYPDPYSRMQPRGVHGPSMVVAPRAFLWHDQQWRGIDPDDLVIYECHTGTYTPAGTFDALIDQLEEIKRLGVTALELMPVAEFAGRRNWGYDGVDLFAPTVSYGGPDALKRLVDAAHGVGLAVLMDVVYNHLGPAGNYLRAFAKQYFTDRYRTPWGEALNYDGPGSKWVRHLVTQNACYWLNEFHCDGLRLDATHAIFDQSRPHILQEIGEQARQAAGARRVAIIAEDGNNDVMHIRPAERDGRGLDGVWADDFHHSIRTFLTGDKDGYFEDFSGKLSDVAIAISEGFIYQGQTSHHAGRPRGTRVTNEPARSFVFCLQNHDQVGNRAFGDRLSQAIDKSAYLAASAVLLLAPETPLLFMGQEFAASTPFCYFTDHEPELGKLVTEGRRAEFKAFRTFSDQAKRELIPDPQAESTYLRSKLDLGERYRKRGVYKCYRDLLTLRRQDAVLRRPDRGQLEVRALGDEVLAMHRWNGDEHRVLLVNFGGRDVRITLGTPGVSVLRSARVRLYSDSVGSGTRPMGPTASWTVIWTASEKRYWDEDRKQPAVGSIHSRPTILVPAATAALLAGRPTPRRS